MRRSTRSASSPTSELVRSCRRLLDLRGEAATHRLAEEVLARYESLAPGERQAFFLFLLHELGPDPTEIDAAIDAYRAEPTPDRRHDLGEVLEGPRVHLFQVLNTATGGTAAVVHLRADLLHEIRDHPELAAVDLDLARLLRTWFNRGFLTLARVDLDTPVGVVEKLIEYDAVHEVQGWVDLRRRLHHDRRCFGLFHPELPGDPIVFVQAALTHGLPGRIAEIIEQPAAEEEPGSPYDTAVFYSINHCQPGLRGIPFGTFLLERVTELLRAELPRLAHFATLSPIPGFVAWLRREVEQQASWLTPDLRDALALLRGPQPSAEPDGVERFRAPLLAACARYLLQARRRGLPLDPVARFHLRNGASVERLNWMGDPSPKGIRQSAGILVNYSYDETRMAADEEQLLRGGVVAASPDVEALIA